MSISRPMERICFLFDAMLGAVETTLVIVALVELASDTPQEIESQRPLSSLSWRRFSAFQ